MLVRFVLISFECFPSSDLFFQWISLIGPSQESFEPLKIPQHRNIHFKQRNVSVQILACLYRFQEHKAVIWEDMWGMKSSQYQGHIWKSSYVCWISPHFNTNPNLPSQDSSYLHLFFGLNCWILSQVETIRRKNMRILKIFNFQALK
jgi:hypothetical protein